MLKNNILSEETLKHIHLQLKRMKSEFIFYCEENLKKPAKLRAMYIHMILMNWLLQMIVKI